MADEWINEYSPDKVTPPGWTLQELLDTQGVSPAELAAQIGITPETIDEIINHGAPLTPAMAIRLETAFGVPASFWNTGERRYRESLVRQHR